MKKKKKDDDDEYIDDPLLGRVIFPYSLEHVLFHVGDHSRPRTVSTIKIKKNKTKRISNH
jgi:hypothetical protein